MKRQSLLVAALAIFLLITILAAFSYYYKQPSLNQEMKQTVKFDFDNLSPRLQENNNTPFNQTINGITAYFSSPSDPSRFSIQSLNTKPLELSNFSGKYLFDNNVSRDILDVRFSQNIIAVNLAFATLERKNQTSLPSDILLTAFEDTVLVGSNKTSGTFSSDSYPAGILSFGSGQPFNWIRISIPSQTTGTTDFLIDNIIIVTIGSSKTP